MARLIGGIVIVLVLYAVISQPIATAAMTRNGVGQLGVAGDRAATFVMNVVGGTPSDPGSAYVPTGGVAAGDGSSVPR